MIQKLTNYASIIGVIGAIGGGFYAWGEFNTRLDAIENKEFVVNETVGAPSPSKSEVEVIVQSIFSSKSNAVASIILDVPSKLVIAAICWDSKL